MATVETVEIVDRKGSGEMRIINKVDFDPKTDTLWSDKDEKAKGKTAATKDDGDDKPTSGRSKR